MLEGVTGGGEMQKNPEAANSKRYIKYVLITKCNTESFPQSIRSQAPFRLIH